MSFHKTIGEMVRKEMKCDSVMNFPLFCEKLHKLGIFRFFIESSTMKVFYLAAQHSTSIAIVHIMHLMHSVFVVDWHNEIHKTNENFCCG